ncbi:Integrin alpha-11, partial [Colius striatus]
ERCHSLHFHVLDTADYVKPVTFSIDYELEQPEQGPMLDDGWPTSLKVLVPFWNGCNEDEHCVPDLVLDARSDVPSAMEFCRRALRRAPPACSAFSLSFDASVFIVESSRRRVAVEAVLENRGENAYSTVLNISFSRNLQFASLIPKDDTDINIDCTTEDKHPNKRVCNVSYPFFRAKAKVAFRLDFEFSKSIFLQSMEIYLITNSDSEEKESTKEDNFAHLNFPLKYEADLLFTRRTQPAPCGETAPTTGTAPQLRTCTAPPTWYAAPRAPSCPWAELCPPPLPPDSHLASPQGGAVWPLGWALALTALGAGSGGVMPCPAALLLLLLQNHSNSDVISINCNVKLAPSQEMNLHLHGNLWMKSLKALKFKSLKLITKAALQRRFGSPVVFREEDPSRQVS